MDFSVKLMLYQAINFIVLMVILTFLFNKFLRPFMHKRSDEIKKAFEDIDGQKKEIESLKKSYQDQADDLRVKAKVEIDRAIAEGNKMRDEIVNRAEKDSSVYLDKAKLEIEQEKQKAVMEIQNEVASLSLKAASRLVNKQMDSETNRRLVEEFLDDLTKNPSQKA
jgi:F-type H+-transporting ATPase subunit b